VPAALAAYDQARRGRTQRLVRVSAGAGRIAEARNPLAATLRDALARLTPPGVYLRASADTLSWTPPAPTATAATATEARR
jgi:2-polyprenyl-6-methoxyphenol hydroxylase-like FAD-dependent oxidoreductase